MNRVSIRTLVLMVELLLTVVAYQYLASAQPAQPDAVWLAGRGSAVQQIQSNCTARP